MKIPWNHGSDAVNSYTVISHRIHGAGIYANMWGILMINVTIYSSTMDPMGMMLYVQF